MTSTMRLNLLDEQWIPVQRVDGRLELVGLVDMFLRASEFTAIADPAPPNVIAIHRLLLAITHRALASGLGAWRDVDRRRWMVEGLPVDLVLVYLERWRDRFWLVHPTHPFMQVAALADAPETRERTKPWTQVSLDRASGNTPVVFDHSVDAECAPRDPRALLRDLLGFLQFTPGGLVKVLKDSDKAGPLANTAAILPTGPSIAATLVQSMHPHVAGADRDLPAWEQAPVTIAKLRAEAQPCTGPCDRYSRLTRAVLFDVEPVGVSQVWFAAGLSILEDAAAPDPMASLRAGHNGMVRIGFGQGRAFWRDLGSLLPDPDGQDAMPASVLSWATAVQPVDAYAELPVLVAGLASDKAKLLRWRLEHVRLPTQVLRVPGVASILRAAIQRAEQLFSELRDVASTAIALSGPDGHSKAARARARACLDASAFAATYFGSSERALPDLLRLLAAEQFDEADQRWVRALEAAAHDAWRHVRDLLGASATALRAEAVQYPKLVRALKVLIDDAA